MTVRADITGRYGNRLYAYEPGDMKLCKWTNFILIIYYTSNFRTVIRNDLPLIYIFIHSNSAEQHAQSQEALENRVVKCNLMMPSILEWIFSLI